MTDVASVTVVPCEPPHILAVESELQSESERQTLILMVQAVPDIAALLDHYARSLLVGDEVVACFGVWIQWPGVGRAWSLISEGARNRYPKSLYKAVRQNLETIIQRDRLRRVEAVIRFGHPTAHGWIRHLGFKNPYLMRNYGLGGVGDFYLYERLTEWPDSPSP